MSEPARESSGTVQAGDAFVSLKDPGIEHYVVRVIESTAYAETIGRYKKSWVSVKSLSDPKKYRLVERDGVRL